MLCPCDHVFSISVFLLLLWWSSRDSFCTFVNTVAFGLPDFAFKRELLLPSRPLLLWSKKCCFTEGCWSRNETDARRDFSERLLNRFLCPSWWPAIPFILCSVRWSSTTCGEFFRPASRSRIGLSRCSIFGDAFLLWSSWRICSCSLRIVKSVPFFSRVSKAPFDVSVFVVQFSSLLLLLWRGADSLGGRVNLEAPPESRYNLWLLKSLFVIRFPAIVCRLGLLTFVFFVFLNRICWRALMLLLLVLL